MSLQTEVARDLDRPAPEPVRKVAEDLLARHGGAIAAILFYGAMLRSDEQGILDLYVLTDSAFGLDRGLVGIGNAVLPPNVHYWEGPGPVRAKIAIMSLTSFMRRARGKGIDTTIWARFCQPAILVHARDGESRRRVVGAIADCVATAASWARHLVPEAAGPEQAWTGLFEHTYRAELRAEGRRRAGSIYNFAPERYDRLLALAPPGRRFPLPRLRWGGLRLAGKVLNLARLAKAAFTFRGGVDYLLWKIERHSGRPAPVTDWQRRHPFLAAPLVLWRLYRAGMIR